jgi:hypothetical protein
MAGGYVRAQKSGQHQIVTFIFAGNLTDDQAKAWNRAIRDLKRALGGSITGITVQGEDSPSSAELDRM